MSVARVATWDRPPDLQDDDDRRARSLYDLLHSLPGFVAGYYMHEAATGRLMNVTIWETEEALEAAERAVNARPVSDQRGISPSKVERWIVDASF
jgi:heme-degrading monooxygenase HmoA